MTNCYNSPASAPPGAASLQIVATDLRQARHVDALLALMDHYARDPAGGGEALPETTLATLPTRLAERSDWVSFLAFADDQAVGLINAFEGFSTFAAQPLLNIHDVVVRREWRRHGIARALLAAISKAARERGCCKLTLEVLSNNHPAMAAYRAAGFVPYELDQRFGQALLMQRWLTAHEAPPHPV